MKHLLFNNRIYKVSYESRFVDEQLNVHGHDKKYLVPILDSEGNVFNIMQVSGDMMGMHDALTALPNRLMFENYYRGQCRLHDGMYLTLFILDIDDFKGVNDTYGHHAGDLIAWEIFLRFF